MVLEKNGRNLANHHMTTLPEQAMLGTEVDPQTIAINTETLDDFPLFPKSIILRPSQILGGLTGLTRGKATSPIPEHRSESWSLI